MSMNAKKRHLEKVQNPGLLSQLSPMTLKLVKTNLLKIFDDGELELLICSIDIPSAADLAEVSLDVTAYKS